jgi:SAM-dependent methyltransferase
MRLAQDGAFLGEVLDAGCGTGENALFLASRGLAVTGVDWSERAIGRARTKARERGLVAEFVTGDALDLFSLGRRFETVLDCGLFHTFDDAGRTAYVRSLAGTARALGVLHLLCFSDLEPGDWGPRRVTQAEIRAAFADGWDVMSIEAVRFATRVQDEGAHAWHAEIQRT